MCVRVFVCFFLTVAVALCAGVQLGPKLVGFDMSKKEVAQQFSPTGE